MGKRGKAHRVGIWLAVGCVVCITGCIGEERIREAAADRLVELMAAEASVDRSIFRADTPAGVQIRQDLFRDLDALDSTSAREVALCIVNALRLSEVRNCGAPHWAKAPPPPSPSETPEP